MGKSWRSAPEDVFLQTCTHSICLESVLNAVLRVYIGMSLYLYLRLANTIVHAFAKHVSSHGMEIYQCNQQRVSYKKTHLNFTQVMLYTSDSKTAFKSNISKDCRPIGAAALLWSAIWKNVSHERASLAITHTRPCRRSTLHLARARLQISQKRNVCFVPTERSFRSKRNVYSETNGTRGKERTVTAAGGKGGASPRQGKREESPFPRERVSRRGYRSRMLIPFISNRYDRCLSVNLARQASA